MRKIVYLIHFLIYCYKNKKYCYRDKRFWLEIPYLIIAQQTAQTLPLTAH